MFPMNLYGLYGQSLADVWLTWVTRGLFIGQRRIMLDTQGMFVLTYPRLEYGIMKRPRGRCQAGFGRH